MEVSYSFDAVMNQLIAWGSIKSRKAAMKRGAGENQFGVGLTNIREYSKKIGKDHELAMDLWHTNNSDAMILATIMMEVSELSRDMLEEMILVIHFYGLLDEFVFNVVAKSMYANELALEWMYSDEELIGRAGWDIIIAKVVFQKPTPVSYEILIDNILMNMKTAPQRKQEVMNRCLCEIGIRNPKYTQQCIQVGEQLGHLVNKTVTKGCTSSYAPEWIVAGVKKRESNTNGTKYL
ncbi:MAG: DNA alkylation repair protein [Mobilitalea sp.]